MYMMTMDILVGVVATMVVVMIVIMVRVTIGVVAMPAVTNDGGKSNAK